MPFGSASKIIIVDDVADMRRALLHTLNRLGFGHVIVCGTGPEVLTALEQDDDIALVISDWNMEPMDGLALLAAIRECARFQALPFILVSAEAGAHRRNQATSAGVTAFLAKPFDAMALGQALADVTP